MKIEFIKSGVFAKDFPAGRGVEVAFVGRSNAGKSSFINALCGRSIAKVSQQPGKTRLLNFFQAPGRLRIVDTPGYGFAKRSASEQKMWQKMIEGYLLDRECLSALYLIMDVRRQWSEDEAMLADLAEQRGIFFRIIFTKIDKLNKKELGAQTRQKKELMQKYETFFVSNRKKTGFTDVYSSFNKLTEEE